MTKFNIKGASFDSLLLTFVKLITTLTAMAQTKILSIGLSLEQYGTYSQVNIIISIASALLMLGLGDAINYFYNNRTAEHNTQRIKTIINTIFFIELVAGAAVLLAILFGRDLIAMYFSNAAIKTLLFFAAVKPMLDNIVYFYQILFVSIGKAKLIAIRNLIVSVFKLIAIYIAVTMLQNLAAIFITLVFLDVVQIIFLKLVFAKNDFLTNPFRGDVKLVKAIIKYSLPMAIFSITNTLTREVDKMVIGYLSDTETMAIYSNCSKLLPFDIISASFATVLIPYIMKYVSYGNKDRSISLFKNYLKIGYYSVWILGGAVLATSQQMISFLYSEEYLVGEAVFVLYVLDSMMRFASMHLILTAGNKTKDLMKYSVFSLLANAVLNIVLFKLVGMIGPAIATLLITLIYTILTLRKSLLILNCKWREIIDIREVCIYLLVLLLTGVGCYFINTYVLIPIMHKYLAMVITVCLFMLTNLLINGKQIKNSLQRIDALK